jgi:hypothetical protein
VSLRAWAAPANGCDGERARGDGCGNVGRCGDGCGGVAAAATLQYRLRRRERASNDLRQRGQGRGGSGCSGLGAAATAAAAWVGAATAAHYVWARPRLRRREELARIARERHFDGISWRSWTSNRWPDQLADRGLERIEIPRVRIVHMHCPVRSLRWAEAPRCARIEIS